MEFHSAMNIKEAYRLCPMGIYMHPNFEKYKTVSQQLHKIWSSYATALEAIALDEAYLDVTKTAKNWEGARKIAHSIKRRTLEKLGLTCSVGVAYSKTAAKTASEEKKPDGYFEIPTARDFVNLIIDRDVRALYTVGVKTAEKLNKAGISTVRDVQNKKDDVIRLLGKQGQMITELAFGIDDRKVVTYNPQNAKSIGREITFQEDVSDYEFLKDVLLLLCLCVKNRANRVGLHGNGITFKITYSNMKTITRSQIISSDYVFTIYQKTVQMLKNAQKQSVRLIGVSLYNLSKDGNQQLSFEDFFEKTNHDAKNKLIMAIKNLSQRYHLDFAQSSGVYEKTSFRNLRLSM